MKMYALFDAKRNKYLRLVYDDRDPWTAKPYEMSSDKKQQQERADKYSIKDNWKRFGYSGTVPKLVLKEFDITPL